MTTALQHGRSILIDTQTFAGTLQQYRREERVREINGYSTSRPMNFLAQQYIRLSTSGAETTTHRCSKSLVVSYRTFLTNRQLVNRPAEFSGSHSWADRDANHRERNLQPGWKPRCIDYQHACWKRPRRRNEIPRTGARPLPASLRYQLRTVTFKSVTRWRAGG